MQSKRRDAVANYSLHMARKYARICVRGFSRFRQANSFPRAKLEESCELQRTDNVCEQISEQIFKVKWKLLRSLSFNCFFRNTRDLLKLGEYQLTPLDIPQFGGVFSHVTRLDQ